MAQAERTDTDGSIVAGADEADVNAIEAAAQAQVPADAAGTRAIHEEEPVLCPPVCLGYAAGAFVVGYGATKKVANGTASEEMDASALGALVRESDVSADASVDELLAARRRA